jgi:glucose/arabinose dehydrogenase
MRAFLLASLPLLLIVGCSPSSSVASGNESAAAQTTPATDRPFTVQEIAKFDEPWAMTFIPTTGQALITEKKGRLVLWSPDGRVSEVAGAPKVDYGGQGGLGDVVLHPDFANNGFIYLSWAEAGEGDTRGAAVGRGKLVLAGDTARIDDLKVIWRQDRKVTGRGHYGHRIAFSPDGYLFISSGERQKFDPAQDMQQNLGKIVRLTDAGGIPSDNPHHDTTPVEAQVWTSGHRNPLGLAFDAEGRLWEHEMGPKGGDEVNLIIKGRNYGYPIVSNGDHYDGTDIPDHPTRPEFEAPKVSWNPSISPAGMIIYSGDKFPAWRGDILMGALSGQALIRIDLDGETARKAEQWDMGQRIREVEQGPDGSVYLLEDEDKGAGGRLLKLVPASR